MEVYIRALRLPFITASVLPFIYGSLKAGGAFRWAGFFFGLVSVAAAHLSANLINDYADSRSGADWKDKNHYGLFGGSKLIQEGILTEKFYLVWALVLAGVAGLCVLFLSVLFRSVMPAACYAVIILLAWSYSQKPLQFSYRRTGEFIIFILFGMAPVMGGYYLQGGAFPDVRSFFLSLPFGFLTTAILFANEVPDYPEDIQAGKRTWVSITGPGKAYTVYGFLEIMGFLSIAANVFFGYAGFLSLASVLLFFMAMKAANMIKKYPGDKSRLVMPSRLTIAVQALASIILIVDALI